MGWHKTRHKTNGLTKGKLAKMADFWDIQEMDRSGINVLANRWFQPLTHVSEARSPRVSAETCQRGKREKRDEQRSIVAQSAAQSVHSPFFDFWTWMPILDGDDEARRFFDRHYSRKRYADGRKPKLFVGPGEKLVLTTPCRRALFVWRKFISGDGQRGINCSIFRNEGAGLSSTLIREADDLADHRWPGERHFTYVNPRAVQSANPGYCFLQAGWRRCGITKWNKLLILERPAS